jgi:LPS sulfotransferase NodH
LQADTTHFIVLSRYRSGSNLLARAIDAHPSAVVHGELFNLENLARQPSRYVGTQFLDEYWQRDFGRPLVGFKFMYGQGTDIELDASYWGPNLSPRIAGYIGLLDDFMASNDVTSWQHLEDQLADHNALRVIHLTRENAFAAYVSFQLALIEDNWSGRPYRTVHGGLRLDVDDLRTWFEYGDSYRSYYDDLFADHPMLRLTYEALSGDYEQTLVQVGEFLGIDGLADQGPRLRKQQTRPLQEVVANYDEVRCHFGDTEWARYFDA